MPYPFLPHKTVGITRFTLATLTFILLSFTLSWAQPKVNVAQLKAKFPNEEMAYLNRSEQVTVDLVNGALQIDVLHQEDRVFLDERASVWADERIYFSDAFQEIKDLEAISYVPEKAGFKRTPVTDFKTERPSPGGGIFFDDMQVKKFTFPGAKQGGIGTVSYRERIKNPYMLSGFVFGNYVPVINSDFSVTFPASVKVSYKTYGDMKGITFKQTTLNGKTTYAWKAQNLKASPLETESLSLRYYVPQVLLFIESYTIDGKTTEVLGNVQKLFNYYKSLVKDLNKQPNAPLQALTDSLTRGKTEEDKIKSIYYWVQDHIKYIAFEEGLGGFIPRQAADVCQKRYGDCKDMASLTSTMLNLAGVPAYLVWIGTRDIPYRYVENPSMSVDNHMIAAVKRNGKWQFLDATDDRIDFGLPTSHIQGKEAMIMTSEDKYEIVPVPIVPAAQNFRRDSMVLSIEGKTLKGKGTLMFEGLWKTSVKSAIQYRSEPQRDEYYKNILSRGSNKSTLEKRTVSGINQRDVPVQFDYTFRVPDYVQEAAGELFINPHLTRTWADKRMEDTRKNDWKHEFAHTQETVEILPIPVGYEVSYLPENRSFSNPDFGFTLSYEQKNGQIIARTKLMLNTLLVKKSSFPEWNKMVEALNEAYSEVISLKKK
ncbi:hypothetical protein DR864_15215 [Runella rosea]|uniref:DUF3857 domain-containing protein n=1 Tax=Runella rosea TaxID=2259595 RepID=A0A344TK30_9BACT|nr:DUF3857 domain-containing protein [Runella rosea]AXE19001.1 hypothetical protein DR864_15215 [Runella rosea]